MATPVPAAAPLAPRAALAFLLTASAAVLVAALLLSFRQGFAVDPATLVLVNGPRVLLGSAAGAAFALAGALRLHLGTARALAGLELLAISAGAATGGALAARVVGAGATTWPAFALGAALLGFAFHRAARALDRPRRWTNPAAAVLLVTCIALAVVVGSRARERGDGLVGAVVWLLGDLSGATLASGGALLALVAAVGALALRSVGDEVRARRWALILAGIGVGAAGPLAFVGALVPRAVRSLAKGAAPTAWLATSAAAGAATVVAIDAVPRLLVGGYDFAWNVPAAMLAIPIFLGWNRARLRREAGPPHAALEALEILAIALLTLVAAAVALFFTRVIAVAT